VDGTKTVSPQDQECIVIMLAPSPYMH